MSKAEERALEAYPKMSRISEPHGEIPADNETHYLGDVNTEKREAYIKGYHQAEKDLELTWEDMMAIDDLLDELLPPRRDSDELVLKGYYEEILKRFKNFKERK